MLLLEKLANKAREKLSITEVNKRLEVNNFTFNMTEIDLLMNDDLPRLFVLMASHNIARLISGKHNYSFIMLNLSQQIGTIEEFLELKQWLETTV